MVRPLPLPSILAPLEPFRDRLLTLKGVNNRLKGDGDGHMRGIGCLLIRGGVPLEPVQAGPQEHGLRGGTEAVPRTLLMVDEFQEFFTEEDRISQGAAVLLDRIDLYPTFQFGGPLKTITSPGSGWPKR